MYLVVKQRKRGGLIWFKTINAGLEKNQTKKSFWFFILHLKCCSIHQWCVKLIQTTQKYEVRIADGFKDKTIFLETRESDSITYRRISVVNVAVFQSSLLISTVQPLVWR